MNSSDAPRFSPDPAAVFACAHSLWEAAQKEADRNSSVNLSEDFNGYDQFMREVMRIGTTFEDWSCENIDFDEWDEVWAYFLGDNFGETCLAVRFVSHLASFDHIDCFRIALMLKMPLRVHHDLPVPVDLNAPNPEAGSEFVAFRIQSVRPNLETREIVPYVMGDDPFDEGFDSPYFGFYGVKADGLMEHVADRANVEELLKLAKNITPGIDFKRERQNLGRRIHT